MVAGVHPGPGPPRYDGGARIVRSVFVGMSLLRDDCENVYGTIREECGALGYDLNRSYVLPGSTTLADDLCGLLSAADYCIFDLTHEPASVYLQIWYAEKVGHTPEQTLIIAREGTQIAKPISPSVVRFYGSIEEIRDIVRRALSVRARTRVVPGNNGHTEHTGHADLRPPAARSGAPV